MNKTNEYTLKNEQNRSVLITGVRDGIPVALGYLAVSFSLGIAARNSGLTPMQSFLVSMLCTASAGEYAGFTVIAAGGSFLEIAMITLIANARYLLMSCALSQRVKPGISFLHRLGLSYTITDEIFAISVARPGYLNPLYSYGAMGIAAFSWSAGTALGCLAGNLMPARLVSAFSVALFGMFLAVIIPPARKSRIIAGLIIICFAASAAAAYLPYISALSDGTRTILLTILIAGGAALLFPRTEDTEEDTRSGIETEDRADA